MVSINTFTIIKYMAVINKRPSDEFRGLATLSELKEISDNPHWFSIYEKICEEMDAGLTFSELTKFLNLLKKICEH